MADSIGKELASQVADVLEKGYSLAYGHRDYCGMGISHVSGHFHYGKVYEGYLEVIEKEFTSREEFINWLAVQTDETLYGREEIDSFFCGNQRINKQRLQNFITI